CLLPLLAVPTSGADKPGEMDAELTYDLKALEDAKVGSDGPALLAFIRQRTLPDDERTRLAELVKKLGDDDFDVREKACASLVKAGRSALPFLRQAQKDRDPEVVRRSRDCLDKIENASDLALAGAVVRVLGVRRPDGADAALIAYLPSVADDALEE